MIFLRFFLLTTALLFATDTITRAANQYDTEKLYAKLDSLMENQQEILEAKRAHIKSIQDGIEVLASSNEQLYNANNKMYDEYMSFQFDSALHYINKNILLTNTDTEPDKYAECRIRMAHILSVAGLFERANTLMKEIQPEKLSTEQQIEYYNQYGELYLYNSEMAQNTPFFKEYIDNAQYYRQLIMQIAPKNSYNYIFNFATYSCERGNVDKAINLLENLLTTLKVGERKYSIITSTLAYFYSRKQDETRQEQYLLLSSISDMTGAILENNSMRELAMFLMQRGEYKKAYKYLNQAGSDATTYGSRLRNMQVAKLAPLITKNYEYERNQGEKRILILLTIISVITIALAIIVAYTMSLIKKRRIANQEISKLNHQLSIQNKGITEMNKLMKESNYIKDEYIGRFLELCSDLLDRGEDRAKQLRRLAREHRMEELFNELKNQRPLNEGKQQFYNNFDTAFLNIYPNFITEANMLMEEDAKFDKIMENEKLNTELRILALIRLGINDNQKIADILRASITTIYTYRSKMKSRAKIKDTFEDDIKRIGKY